MAIHEPSRGGTRGGKDQFVWKNVEVDKHRENYLANSLMAPVGRWQKGKDLTWYTKDSKVLGKKEKLKLEMAAVKKAEEEAMARALGLKTGPAMKPTDRLSKEEIAEVCKRRTEDDEVLPEDRIKGVGFKSQRNRMMGLSMIASNDGTTKFEQDPQEGSKTSTLVLRTVSTDSRHRTVSASSDQYQVPIPKNDNQDVWVAATDEKKHKKRKKAKKEAKKHTRHDDSKKHGGRGKNDRKRKFKKRRNSNSSSCVSSDDSDNNSDDGHSSEDNGRQKRSQHNDRRKTDTLRRTRDDIDKKKGTRHLERKRDRSVNSESDNEVPIRKRTHLDRERNNDRRITDRERDSYRGSRDSRSTRTKTRNEGSPRRNRHRNYSPDQRRRPRHDTDSSD